MSVVGLSETLSVSIAQGSNLYQWDLGTGERIHSFPGLKGKIVTSLALSPDGSLLAAGVNTNSIFLFDGQTGNLIRELSGHTGTPFSLVFLPDGQTLVSGSTDGTVRFWDASTGQQTRLFDLGREVWGLNASTNGDSLAVGTDDGHVTLWSANMSLEDLRTWIEDTRYVRDLSCLLPARHVST